MCQSHSPGYEVRPDELYPDIKAAYADMDCDELREKVAMEWIETAMGDAGDETWWAMEAGQQPGSPDLFAD